VFFKISNSSYKSAPALTINLCRILVGNYNARHALHGATLWDVLVVISASHISYVILFNIWDPTPAVSWMFIPNIALKRLSVVFTIL